MKKLGKSIEGFCFFILSLDKLHSLKTARLSNSSASMEKPSCQSYLVSNTNRLTALKRSFSYIKHCMCFRYNNPQKSLHYEPLSMSWKLGTLRKESLPEPLCQYAKHHIMRPKRFELGFVAGVTLAFLIHNKNQ